MVWIWKIYIYCINGGIDVDYKKIAGFVKNIGIGKLLLLFGMGILLMTLEFGARIIQIVMKKKIILIRTHRK